ncbi:DUF2778 domain-containing protein [Noviherbaspirillum sp. Root189]|uniref:DUF2778 domain-containing protein n=1 Tax=Noviherbaspirillum sp. Root189 TaxID=1736487 RepID=UPI002286BD4E|nr:DUF2778 domain-containing protein [Noviherbaspirillum sp. Root189]
MSTFRLSGQVYSAFSGLGKHANQRAMACMKHVGPIPPGRYFILDRQSGGRLGKVRDLVTGRTDWFSLYAIDQRLDDETYCDQVSRGNFRLHPKGGLGRSEGCVVIDHEADFRHLRMVLTSVSPVKVTGTDLKVYGTLQVS